MDGWGSFSFFLAACSGERAAAKADRSNSSCVEEALKQYVQARRVEHVPRVVIFGFVMAPPSYIKRVFGLFACPLSWSKRDAVLPLSWHSTGQAL